MTMLSRALEQWKNHYRTAKGYINTKTEREIRANLLNVMNQLITEGHIDIRDTERDTVLTYDDLTQKTTEELLEICDALIDEGERISGSSRARPA